MCSWFDVCWCFGVVGLAWYLCCRLQVFCFQLKVKFVGGKMIHEFKNYKILIVYNIKCVCVYECECVCVCVCVCARAHVHVRLHTCAHVHVVLRERK